jgi:23S rRNA (pseudouridine1915-N3)-methyltransferase
MNIKIVSLRKSSPSLIEKVEQEYLERLRKYAKLELVDLKRDKIKGNKAKIFENERGRLEMSQAQAACTVVLTDKGKQLTSEEFARFIDTKIKQGIRSLSFIIGGPLGLSDDVVNNATHTFSLSRLTLPHKIVRLLLIEALYRSFDMLHGGPYHK